MLHMTSIKLGINLGKKYNSIWNFLSFISSHSVPCRFTCYLFFLYVIPHVIYISDIAASYYVFINLKAYGRKFCWIYEMMWWGRTSERENDDDYMPCNFIKGNKKIKLAFCVATLRDSRGNKQSLFLISCMNTVPALLIQCKIFYQAYKNLYFQDFNEFFRSHKHVSTQ